MISSLFLLGLQALAVSAKTVTFDWSVDWVSVSPDGFERPAIGINGQWPCPTITVDIGDRVIVNLKNNLGNETTAIHWHGLYQTGTAQMDGPAMVNQCPIPPGSSFTYDFEINQPGTYWYHSHVGGQYIDGFRGPIVVHDPAAPYAGQYDEEVIMTVSDWYHTEAPYLIEYFQSPLNEDLHGGSEPVPNATLINHAQNVKFNVQPNKVYLFRIINTGAFAAQFVEFDQHQMDVVEVDGVYTKSHRVSQLFLTAAQRYSVLISTKHSTNNNFVITASMNDAMFDEGVIPPSIMSNVTGYLIYDDKKPLPPSKDIVYDESAFEDTKFTPFDNAPPLGPVTHPITLTMAFGPSDADQNRASFNGVSYVAQKVPTLYTALSAPADLVNNPLIYGVNSNPFVLPKDAIVEITLINTDGGPHPFHLHSHKFQVISRGDAGPDNGPPLMPSKHDRIPDAPMRRDTVLVYPMSYIVLRFQADNPGVTLFHCHIEWHVEAGLTATFIEAPTELQALGLVIPEDHKQACKNGNISMVGNAAGNSVDWLDLTGANTQPPLENWGALTYVPANNDGLASRAYHRIRRTRVGRALKRVVSGRA
ncbi:FET Ferroxidase [Acephala macrosclerotiorum]|nr:FET Ferroxidase [Acephala macrosclerotiorum]